jgi:hypothetical protein
MYTSARYSRCFWNYDNYYLVKTFQRFNVGAARTQPPNIGFCEHARERYSRHDIRHQHPGINSLSAEPYSLFYYCVRGMFDGATQYVVHVSDEPKSCRG